MRRKALTPREQRMRASLLLLNSIFESGFPQEYTGQDEIEHLLGLKAAGLLKAEFDSPTRARSGEVRIPRAVGKASEASVESSVEPTAQAASRMGATGATSGGSAGVRTSGREVRR